MAKRNSTSTDVTISADGFSIGGGTTTRTLTLTSGDTTITGGGSGALVIPVTGTDGSIKDDAGVKVIGMTKVASAVNYISALPSATGNAVAVQALGSDSNIALNLDPKGTGKVQINGTAVIAYDGYIHVQDQKASGTAGGTSIATTWTDRALNTIAGTGTGIGSLSGVAISSNQLTSVPAGTYQVYARSPMFISDGHKCRIRNITDGATLLVGSSVYNDSATGAIQTDSTCLGRFTISGTKTISLQYYSQIARATNGLGVKTTSGEVEVYGEIILQREIQP